MLDQSADRSLLLIGALVVCVLGSLVGIAMLAMGLLIATL